MIVDVEKLPRANFLKYRMGFPNSQNYSRKDFVSGEDIRVCPATVFLKSLV